MSAPAASVTGNPFIGLRRFEMEDSALFFGRTEQSYDLLRRLALLHFVAVMGPSGCGKSSLVRAGVLASLQQGYLAEDGPWTIVTLQPAADPLEEWKRSLTPHLKPGMEAKDLIDRPAEALDASKGKIAILVDQFEELFSFNDRTGRASEVEQFLRAMLSMGDPDGKIYVIITMRSEYLVRCALYPELAEAINEGLYLVPRMTHEQLRQAIVAPTKKAGAAITVALIDRLLDNVAGEDDGLPILQHALMRMWPRRPQFAPMGLELYPQAGGLGAFLDSHAELVYNRLNPADQAVAEALFRCITERTPEGRVVRRAQQLHTIAQQTGIPSDQLLRVVREFEAEGFLIPTKSDSPLVDISHEAVARQWKRLGTGIWVKRDNGQEWIEGWIVVEARERRAVLRLKEAAREWARNDRDKSYLFRGPLLKRLEFDVGKQRDRGGDLERAFLAASKKADFLSTLFSARTLATIGLVVGIVLGVVWLVVSQRSELEEANQVAKDAESQATESRVAEAIATQEAATAQATAQTILRQQEDPEPVTPAAVTKPRIYSQVRTEAQQQELKPLLETLKAKGYAVPAPKPVNIGPNKTELRYFRRSEEEMAKKIVSELADASVTAVARYVSGFENSTKIRDNHFELWMAPPTPSSNQPSPGLSRSQVVVLYLDESRHAEASEIGNAVSRFSAEYNTSVTSYGAVTWTFSHPTELHYFHQEDRAEAEKMTGRLQDAGAFYVKARFMPVKAQIPRRYFEIWLQAREIQKSYRR